MSERVTLLGLESDAAVITRRAYELGLSAASARWLSVGTIEADGVDEWVGVTPVEGRVILRAPDPKPGDEPNTWLHFHGDLHANTSDLLVLRA